jgi:hypothetical protein
VPYPVLVFEYLMNSTSWQICLLDIGSYIVNQTIVL